MTEDKTVGWHHRLNGHEFEHTLGDSEGQGSLVCCGPWDYRIGYDLATEQQHNTNMVGRHESKVNYFENHCCVFF